MSRIAYGRFDPREAKVPGDYHSDVRQKVAIFRFRVPNFNRIGNLCTTSGMIRIGGAFKMVASNFLESDTT